jgi:tripartite-type tricarboxylate transporter receptor subunit TctC
MPWRARTVLAILATLQLSVLGSVAADAQSWPSRPVTLIDAFAVGSIGDTVGRAIARPLQDVLGQPVIFENRSGGGGAIASVSVAKAPADGYTLLLTTIGPAVLRPLIDSKVNYDPVADFAPVVLVGDIPNVLVTGQKHGLGSVQELVAYAKKNPGHFSLAHPGTGTMGHLLVVLFASATGIDANMVGYRGGARIALDIAGGQVDAAIPAYGPEESSNKILAVATEERVDFLPGIPTLKENDLPSVVGSTWYGIYAPAGTPADVVAKLNAAVNTVLGRDDIRKQFTTIGFRALGGTAERLKQHMVDDRAKWSEVIRAAKITIDQ